MFCKIGHGHVGLARRAIAELSLDRLIVLPANVSPFKAPCPMPWDRLASVRAAFADMAEAEVDDRELRRGGVSYAIDAVREIIAEGILGTPRRID